MRDGSAELKDICDQLDRYGTGTMPDCFLDLLWVMTDINDCLAHDRNPAIIRETINMARALLDVLAYSSSMSGYFTVKEGMAEAAADEIERLRGLLREILPHFERGQPILWQRIREALGDAD
jgi:hypothetical protein